MPIYTHYGFIMVCKTQLFIDEANTVHRNKYSYSFTQYKDTKTKVLITCPDHGDFLQRPDSHLKHTGCKGCKGEERRIINEQVFYEKANALHNRRFDYSKSHYVSASVAIDITCPVHGPIKRKPSAHLKGFGCKYCGYDHQGTQQRFTQEDFLTKAKAVHGDKYDYSQAKYITGTEKVKIICPHHGPFHPEARKHLEGQNCKKCYAYNKRNNQGDIISAFRKVHGKTYNYDLVNYKGIHHHVIITCSKHGEFPQLPSVHRNGSGCPSCAGERVGELKRISADEFFSRVAEKHKNRFEYIASSFKGLKEPISYYCPVHGLLEQLASSHLSGRGCRECGYISNSLFQRKTQSQFIDESLTIHGNKYDYSKVDYKGDGHQVKIGCKIHGFFQQVPSSHLTGAGCKKCATIINANKQRRSQAEFIQKTKNVHGKNYDFSLVKYCGAHELVTVVCRKHGKFDLTANSLLVGRGCNKCGQLRGHALRKISTEDFVAKAKFIHGDKYDYYLVEYETAKDDVTIICSVHGRFQQSPTNHLSGNGCSSCATYGFDSNKPAILYYLKVETATKVAYKIGVTNRTIEERFSGEMDNISVIAQWYFTSGINALSREQEILKEYSDFQYQGEPILSSGNTELFDSDVLDLENCHNK